MLALGFFAGTTAQETTDGPPGDPHAVVLEIDGPMGPASYDYLRRSLAQAGKWNTEVVILRLNTPGGLVKTTRKIVGEVLEADVPVAVHVAPEGARAASAGTYLAYGAHVSAMASATHLGAATPVRMSGSPVGPGPQKEEEGDGEGQGGEAGEPSQTKESAESPSGKDPMRRKLTNDAAAYLRSLAEFRGRNAEWAEKSVREGASLTATEAVEKNVVDFLAEDTEALLQAMDGTTVRVAGGERTLGTEGLTLRNIDPDWRTRLLSILANPNVAYIFMLLGIYGLIFEFSNPGSIGPGIAGSIFLLIGLFSLQMLPINIVGMALILLGVALMTAEAFAPSFGVFGVGGIVAFSIGSIMLIDTDVPGFAIYWPVIVTFAALSAVLLIFVLAMALRAWKRPVVTGSEAIVGASAVALEDFERMGRVRLEGDSWKARSDQPVRKGETVEVRGRKGLQLDVKSLSEKQDHPNQPEES
jgi:membrane-bound serine protease (ClpP class)